MFSEKEIQEVAVTLQSTEVQALLGKLLIEFNYLPEYGNPLVFILGQIGTTYETLKERIAMIEAITDRKNQIIDIQSEIDSIEKGEIPLEDL